MAIRGRVGIPALAVGTGDTTLVDISSLSVDRVAVAAMNFNNTTGASIDITIWESPDATSASGTQIDSFPVPANLSEQSAVIGQGYDNTKFLVAQASAVGVNASTTLTDYDGGD